MFMNKLGRALLLLLTVSLSAQNQLTPKQERGRQIYEHGISPSDVAIKASLGGGTQVAASIVPCINCHGNDGLGRPESGVVPPNITWDALTKPYGLKDSDGSVRAPYTDRLLKRAISMGIDSGGHTLDAAMPRFQLAAADATDLVAYIKRLGGTVDPGLTETAVRVGIILPRASHGATTAGMVRQALLDFFDRVNAAGGVFGRRIELVFMQLPAAPEQRADVVREFLRKEQPFAVIGDSSGAELQIAAVMRTMGTPAIATFAPFPQTGPPLNRFVFYLDGGVEEEQQVLLDLAAKQFPAREQRIAIVCSKDEVSRDAARWLVAQLHESGRQHVVVNEEGIPVRADIVFWDRTGITGLAEMTKSGGEKAILISGSLSEVSLAGALPSDPRVFLALGPGLRPGQPNVLSRLVWERATASASLLTEALRTVGHGLSRASVLQTLESFHGIQTNLPVPISFGPDRRVGATYIRVMTFDPVSQEFRAVSGYGADSNFD
jgi:ABC-type branched-subunit amino acid transport system substrate-binding protein